jgi:hypothetical protein
MTQNKIKIAIDNNNNKLEKYIFLKKKKIGNKKEIHKSNKIFTSK